MLAGTVALAAYGSSSDSQANGKYSV